MHRNKQTETVDRRRGRKIDVVLTALCEARVMYDEGCARPTGGCAAGTDEISKALVHVLTSRTHATRYSSAPVGDGGQQDASKPGYAGVALPVRSSVLSKLLSHPRGLRTDCAFTHRAHKQAAHAAHRRRIVRCQCSPCRRHRGRRSRLHGASRSQPREVSVRSLRGSFPLCSAECQANAAFRAYHPCVLGDGTFEGRFATSVRVGRSQRARRRSTHGGAPLSGMEATIPARTSGFLGVQTEFALARAWSPQVVGRRQKSRLVPYRKLSRRIRRHAVARIVAPCPVRTL